MSENLGILEPVHSETGFKTDYKKSTIQEFIGDIPQSYSDFMGDQIAGFMAKNMNDALYDALKHEVDTPKIILFFEHIRCCIWKACSKLRNVILDTKYKNEKIVKIRKAGSMMTLDEAMEGMPVLKTLKDFGDWVYKYWAYWDGPKFNWSTIATWCYDERPDNRIGWNKTWMVAAAVGTSPKSGSNYPIAFTDKPFYALKCNGKDRLYIQEKYPGLFERTKELSHNHCFPNTRG